MTLETSVERHLKSQVEKVLAGMCIKLMPRYHAGLPDRLVLLPGPKVVFIETKARSGRIRSAQLRVRDRLVTLGFEWRALYTRAEVNLWISNEVLS